jgi:hypothetical protein
MAVLTEEAEMTMWSRECNWNLLGHVLDKRELPMESVWTSLQGINYG